MTEEIIIDGIDISECEFAENEALRNQCNKCKQYAIEQNNRKLLNENEKLKEKYLSTLKALTAYSTQFTGILQENINYETALEEIREIAEYECVYCEHPGDCHPLCDKFKIKNKINEVING